MTIPSFQQDAWNRLVNLAEQVPHALLVHGPQGVGKLQLAERFAQLLLCETARPRMAPCGSCDGCRWFLAGHHPDVRLVEPETIAYEDQQNRSGDSSFLRANREAVRERVEAKKIKPSAEIKIEQVRALYDFVNLGSHRGGKRIVLVHPAEAMNPISANGLLKSLEEPPAGAMFVLVSHRPARLLPTVRSRCVSVPVPLPGPAAAQAWLDAQGVRDAARRLAFAGGAPLKALEDAKGERGSRADRILEALRSNDLERLEGARDRETLELLAEVLQRCACDGALASFGLPPKYGCQGGSKSGTGREWLAYARRLGHDRALARHPLNPGLHATAMLDGFPRK
ncbi:MAG TPA: DNA polymerase III subunit delta' [Burkholderiales bacterium]|nr:DNA polymerase III subunit delta' [Burkholderiales bacterium]